MMKRIKVINEPTELVPMLRAVSTKVRREVFALVSQEWCTLKMIEEKFGEEGKEALRLFEKMKLVETRWQSKEGSTQPEKAFHSYYMSFHINASCPVTEISDVLSVAVMPDIEYEKWEKKIVNLVGNDGKFAGDLAEQLGITSVMLKSLVKRSGKLEFRGHRVERLKE
jgi:predicted DNA-binding ArsR family transcriptional regulator